MLFIPSSETELARKEHTGDGLVQECLDGVRGVCVPDTPDPEEEQHLQHTEVDNISLFVLFGIFTWIRY